MTILVVSTPTTEGLGFRAWVDALSNQLITGDVPRPEGFARWQDWAESASNTLYGLVTLPFPLGYNSWQAWVRDASPILEGF